MVLEDAMVRAHGKKTRPCSVIRGTWPDVAIEISGFVTTLHPARIVKRILPNVMDVFEFLPKFWVIVCKLCQSAIRPSAVGTHLQRVHAQHNSSPASEKQIFFFFFGNVIRGEANHEAHQALEDIPCRRWKDLGYE